MSLAVLHFRAKLFCLRGEILYQNLYFFSAFLAVMGSKRKALRRSVNATQKLRYPVGELALRKKQLKDNFLSKSKELNSLRKKLNRAKDKVCFGIVYYVC